PLTPLSHLPLLCTAPPPTEPYTLSLHDALPISSFGYARQESRIPCSSSSSFKSFRSPAVTGSSPLSRRIRHLPHLPRPPQAALRSEEHTSELQSRFDLVCRLLLEKKNTRKNHV